MDMLTKYANIETVSFSLTSLLGETELEETGGLFKNKIVMDLIEKYFDTFLGKDLISSKAKDIQVFKKDLKYIRIKDYIAIKDFSEDAIRNKATLTIREIANQFNKIGVSNEKYLCVSCKKNYVNSDDGFDTCADCMALI